MREVNPERLIEGDPSIPDEERVFSDRELARHDADGGTQEPAPK